MNLPRIFTIRESSHRIHNPFSAAKLAALGASLHLPPDARVLDLGCGSGELLCTWARAHGVRGVGVDLEPEFIAKARARASELDVSDRVAFTVGDAAGHVADQAVDVGVCLGATWIAGGLIGTVDLLERSVVPGGLVVVGDVYWRRVPADDAVARASGLGAVADLADLPGTLAALLDHGFDVVSMVLADQDDWDSYVAAQWFNLRAFVDAHPDDELADTIRTELRESPLQHARYQREYLGWGTFALRRR